MLQQTLTNYSRFQVHKDSTWHMLSSSSFTEEGGEGVISTPNGLLTWHLPIWLNPMFQAVQLPAGVAHLYAGLANVD